jgi:hypothetical protein
MGEALAKNGPRYGTHGRVLIVDLGRKQFRSRGERPRLCPVMRPAAWRDPCTESGRAAPYPG